MRARLRSKVTLLFIVCAALLAFAGTAVAITADPSGNTAPAPTIQSDKADYSPGELVHIQDRFRAMSYGNEHETSYLRTYAF